MCKRDIISTANDSFRRNCPNCHKKPDFTCRLVSLDSGNRYAGYLVCGCGFIIMLPQEYSTCTIDIDDAVDIHLTDEQISAMVYDLLHFSKLYDELYDASMKKKHMDECGRDKLNSNDGFDSPTLKLVLEYCRICNKFIKNKDRHDKKEHAHKNDMSGKIISNKLTEEIVNSPILRRKME